MDTVDSLKDQLAIEALSFISSDLVLGLGSGKTVNIFIDHLAESGLCPLQIVAASHATEAALKKKNIPFESFNNVAGIDLYIDSADQVNQDGVLIKGGGGALTREKILAVAANKFLCLVEASKYVERFTFPVAVEVVPMARSYIARRLIALGGQPVYRADYTTDNGQDILDVYELNLQQPSSCEQELELLPGVLSCGLFSERKPDVMIVSDMLGQSQRIIFPSTC